jgi:hypothetical protein
MYTIRRGLAAKAGAVMAAGMHFGDDFLLTNYFRPYTVRALTFLDCFRMDRAVLYQLFQYKQFPNFQVRGAGRVAGIRAGPHLIIQPRRPPFTVRAT